MPLAAASGVSESRSTLAAAPGMACPGRGHPGPRPRPRPRFVRGRGRGVRPRSFGRGRGRSPVPDLLKSRGPGCSAGVPQADGGRAFAQVWSHNSQITRRTGQLCPDTRVHLSYLAIDNAFDSDEEKASLRNDAFRQLEPSWERRWLKLRCSSTFRRLPAEQTTGIDWRTGKADSDGTKGHPVWASVRHCVPIETGRAPRAEQVRSCCGTPSTQPWASGSRCTRASYQALRGQNMVACPGGLPSLSWAATR